MSTPRPFRSALHSLNAVLAGFMVAWVVLNAGPAAAQAGRTDRIGILPSDPSLPPLWLKSHIVQATVQGRLARVTADSVYHNDSARDLEAFYTFPLPEGAALDRFVLWMDGEPVEAKVAERQRALQTYERIVSRMRDPGLLEQVGENLFRYRIYPVKARGDQRVKIEYSYILPLGADERTLRFEYPLGTPRNTQDSSRIAKDFAVTVKLELEGAIATLESPSHKTSRRIDRSDPRKATVSIEEAYTALDQDFRLVIGLKDRAPAITSLAYRAGPAEEMKAEDGFLLLTLTPRLPPGVEPPGKDVLMVMDTSGSMQNVKILQARAALCECLERLNPADRFGLIAFSDSVTCFNKDWQPATKEAIAAARAFVERLNAEGSTDIGEALKAALAFKPGEGRLRQILFATDGLPTVGEQDIAKLVELVPAAEGVKEPVRFYTFGIGFDVNTRLLDRIAERTKGERAYVQEHERIDRKVAELCDKIAAPVLTDVKLEFSPELAVGQIYPRVPGELYAGRQMVLTARYGQPGTGQVTLRGKRGAQEVVLTAPLMLPARSGEATAGLARQWAVRKVGFLLDNIRLHGENAELREEVTRLGTRYGIVTPYTSFLALEKKDREQFDAETNRLAEERRARDQAAAASFRRSPAPNSSAPATSRDVPPTDPTSSVASDIVVPPEILRLAELGDHWESYNPDRPDTHSAFGNPDAHMFHSESGADDSAGGGGVGGKLEDVVGVGGGGSPGTGGGWGGGNGTGIGVDQGAGRGVFGQRNGGGRRLMVLRHGGSRATEASVDRALAWLAKNQEADGHWDSKKFGAAGKMDTACTGLALLALLGAGHTEKVGQYKANVRGAVAWLKSKQDAEGLIFDSTEAGGLRGVCHPHAVAGTALAEAAGMARAPDTVAAAQKAVDYSVNKHQNGEGHERRGFGNEAGQAGNLSVTGWFVMQLKSAKVAGLSVDHAAFEGAIRFLDSVERKGAGGDKGYGPASVYSYRPEDPREESAHRLTAIGTLCRQFLGWKKEDLQATVQWFMEKGGLPETSGEKTDLLYWYYGTLSAFQQGGDTWKRWNEALKKMFVDSQRKGGDEDGSWDPVGEHSSDWGRVGQTALCALCSEVYYRYLPMYKGGGSSFGAPAPVSPAPAPVPPAAVPTDKPAARAEPVQAPSSETGREAVEYSEYLRMLQEGQTPEKK